MSHGDTYAADARPEGRSPGIKERLDSIFSRLVDQRERLGSISYTLTGPSGPATLADGAKPSPQPDIEGTLTQIESMTNECCHEAQSIRNRL